MRRTDNKEFTAKALKQGTGLVCPQCGGKFLVNLAALWKALKSRDLKMAVCPYCEYLSFLPEKAE